MGFADMIDLVEEIGDLDEKRRETFEGEFAAFEDGDADGFPRTRACIAEERERLDELAELLAEERERLDELIEETEFLTVDQAVRHREQVIEKLERHNEHLETFRESMERALRAVEANLTVLVETGPEGALEDAEAHLVAAEQAIQEHNEAVVDLDRNLLILDAYLPGSMDPS